MIFLYFEDWSQFTFMLDQRGVEHGGRIIKTYASPFDPRQRLDNPNLKVIQTDDSTLMGIKFGYKERGIFTGDEIEARIANLDTFPARTVRGLLRFSNREDLRFCQTGMEMKKEGQWLISHPIEDIDGLSTYPLWTDIKNATIHLDIFNANSLKNLSHVLDISRGSSEMLDPKLGIKLKREIQAEVLGLGQERK
jgi:hypothetical protein